jgi:glycosyltransferase involved in cell wall biosynthesis
VKSKISILIPIFNTGSILEAFFEALQNQTLNFETELLICNDKSTDQSLKIIQKHIPLLERKYSVRFFDNEVKQGWKDTLEMLYEKSLGDIIVFVDSDAVPSNSEWLVELTNELIKDESISVVQGNFWNQFYTNNFVSENHKRWRRSVYMSRFKGKDNFLLTTNTRNLACKRSVIENVKKSFGSFMALKTTSFGGGDIDLGFKIKKLGYKIVLNEKAVVRHADPVKFIDLLRQKIRHGKGDAKIGILHKNNFYYSVLRPFWYDNVSLLFSIPVTMAFTISNHLAFFKNAIANK